MAEGRQAVREALGRPGTVETLLIRSDTIATHRDLLTRSGSPSPVAYAVSPQDFALLTDTVTPQGVLAVCRRIEVTGPESVARTPRLVVLCAQVRDPGNLGTVIRCADAFGADAVWVTKDSVDLYNPKTVRATTGSLFHLPIATGVELAGAVAWARDAGLQVLGADGRGTVTVHDLARSGGLDSPTLWVLGNEAWGLPPEQAALVDRLVSVPIFGRAESLNLSTAAAVLLYASATAQNPASGARTAL